MQAGLSSSAVVTAFLTSPEFTSRHATAQLFVASLYRLLLSRDGEAAGVAHWEGLLDGGTMTRTEVVRAFLGSTESRSQVLDAVYAQLLQRPIDPSGYDTFLPEAATGDGVNQILVALLASDEFFAMRTH